MHLYRSCVIAFSIYSKIPMPQFEWKDEDMKYMLCFFPWVGAAVGVAFWLWQAVCLHFGISELCRIFVGTAIVVLLTGGIHVDGFMDTMDAFHSYRPREKKLEILKDAHIGAFAVIMLAGFGLLWLGGLAQISDVQTAAVTGCSFFLARALSGIGVVSFPPAKKDGMLQTFAETARKKRVRTVLIVQAVLCATLMLYLSFAAGVLALAAAALAFVYYRYRTKKELGGVTGDTAGYFLVLCEIGMTLAAALAGVR